MLPSFPCRALLSQLFQPISYSLFLCSSRAIDSSRTLSVPLVHRVPGPLAAVLNVPDLGETSTGNAEELYECALACWLYHMEGVSVVVGRHTASYKIWSALGLPSRKARDVAAYHDPIGEESFEGDTHVGGGYVFVAWERRLGWDW